jgi:deoxyribonuclease V
MVRPASGDEIHSGGSRPSNCVVWRVFMHPWNLNEDEARDLQENLASDCVLEGDPEVDTVAGVDVSVKPDSRIGIVASVLYSVEEEDVIDRVVMIDDLSFPYIPGLLAFREAPMMLKAVMKLDEEPDCLLVDGHGYAHPRRFGLASHLGLLLETPSIGCAKNLLVGDYEDLGESVGSQQDVWDGEPVGFAYRSLEGANPIFLSPGHLIGLRNISEVVEPLLNGRTKLPEPLYRSHQAANRERKQLDTIRESAGEDDPLFLVGGCLRDLLIGQSPKDYDVLVTEVGESLKSNLEQAFDGRLFPLDDDRGIYRLAGKDVQIDITEVEEGGLVEDLERRDFTINSIALDLNQESWIDPGDGREDVEEQVLRPMGPTSIDDDPLRVLRAYRLAQHHNLIFHESLEEQIRSSASRLTEVSRERVVDEMLLMATGQRPDEWYKKMHEDGVLTAVPFFRREAHRDLERLGFWTETLVDIGEPFDQLVHGTFRLIDGFKAARTIAQDELGSWPFHRRIKSMVRASYRELPDDPGFDVLRNSRERLAGRIVGRALREDWESDRLRSQLEGLDSFLAEKHRLEKKIVREIDGEGDIAEQKEARLKSSLGEIWRERVRE